MPAGRRRGGHVALGDERVDAAANSRPGRAALGPRPRASSTRPRSSSASTRALRGRSPASAEPEVRGQPPQRPRPGRAQGRGWSSGPTIATSRSRTVERRPARSARVRRRLRVPGPRRAAVEHRRQRVRPAEDPGRAGAPRRPRPGQRRSGLGPVGPDPAVAEQPDAGAASQPSTGQLDRQPQGRDRRVGRQRRGRPPRRTGGPRTRRVSAIRADVVVPAAGRGPGSRRGRRRVEPVAGPRGRRPGLRPRPWGPPRTARPSVRRRGRRRTGTSSRNSSRSTVEAEAARAEQSSAGCVLLGEAPVQELVADRGRRRRRPRPAPGRGRRRDDVTATSPAAWNASSTPPGRPVGGRPGRGGRHQARPAEVGGRPVAQGPRGPDGEPVGVLGVERRAGRAIVAEDRPLRRAVGAVAGGRPGRVDASERVQAAIRPGARRRKPGQPGQRRRAAEDAVAPRPGRSPRRARPRAAADGESAAASSRDARDRRARGRPSTRPSRPPARPADRARPPRRPGRGPAPTGRSRGPTARPGPAITRRGAPTRTGRSRVCAAGIGGRPPLPRSRSTPARPARAATRYTEKYHIRPARTIRTSQMIAP